MYFLIPVALFALCLAHGIVRAVQDVRWERRVFWDAWTDKARSAFHRMALEDLERRLASSPFVHKWNDEPVTVPTTVPEHLRGSMGKKFEEVDWVITRAAFKITKDRPHLRSNYAFLINDIVT